MSKSVFGKIVDSIMTRSKAEEGQRAGDRGPSGVLPPIVFVAPSYDGLTQVMSGWLREIAESQEADIKLLLEGDASWENVANSLSSSCTDSMMVYYGNGSEECFLTDLKLGCSPHDSGHSVLFSSADVPDEFKISIIAYCCLSATGLGADVRSKSSGNGFLGFTRILPFKFGSERREAAFKIPMQLLIEGTLDRGCITSDHWRQLHNYYSDQYEIWSSDDMEEDDPYAMLVAMFLDEHRMALAQKVR